MASDGMKAEIRGAIKAQAADILQDIQQLDNLIMDWVFLQYGIDKDGVIINEERATDANVKCKCVDVAKSSGQHEDLCWKPGVIGMLNPLQRDALCPPPSRIFPESAKGLGRRLEAFEEAAETCKGLGTDDLTTRLACLSAELKTKGTKLGTA